MCIVSFRAKTKMVLSWICCLVKHSISAKCYHRIWRFLHFVKFAAISRHSWLRAMYCTHIIANYPQMSQYKKFQRDNHTENRKAPQSIDCRALLFLKPITVVKKIYKLIKFPMRFYFRRACVCMGLGNVTIFEVDVLQRTSTSQNLTFGTIGQFSHAYDVLSNTSTSWKARHNPQIVYLSDLSTCCL